MKPYVILSAAMTLDGKIATKTGSSEISGEKDLERVHKLRSDMDAIMVGIGTVLVDDPRLTVHKVPAKKEDNPIRVIVDSKARTPLNSRILNADAKTIIAVGNNADPFKINNLSDKVDVLVTNGEKGEVNLMELMDYLKNIGVNSLMLEGGATLNFSMFNEGLIDEIRVCVAPMIAGGKFAKTLVDGEGFDKMNDAVKLSFKESYILDGDLVLIYLVKNFF
ncbi:MULTISPECIES: 2,5-diamino-6-(ribosylamino)-4(3H)-pyrimidinone 5'-phosphate reductase [Methanobrevibacter]|jgi:2,5-diamino-6-(ribosylamino)-4(3H)-pyrimidinone 5'-phosphate reductase|uniref:2,5-diamino-6-(ribosylamino)-4(3H)-pyrimidinone 5'-phosphate reductase n=1 Tax=Methanobrevibacter TaxID=2172 RepID=UPI002A1698CD|nr:2,5-diamino-6-(ribosylamino)-4(3H)-pyrimidinone 5'-phosphate reductase [Methanobacteriaceae archaeon]MDD4593824.1 2,5-diamino-6-(ribosylamino)-4(3H)-pyrimidinone 5'-phosphate reductase [Methanobacteriaceae archaeon]